MSNRNSQANKQAARERLRAERERQAKKDRMRRQLTVAGSVVAALAIAGGIGVALSNMNSGSKNVKVSDKDWRAAAAKTPYKAPANTEGEKGLTIVIGGKTAKETIDLYEDPRCTGCAMFEQRGTGDAVVKGAEDGRYKVRFIMANFIDGMAGGSGSKNAVSALGAALNVSPEAFLEFKTALYSAENHPAERDDAFSDDERLIEIAQEVKALKGNKAFEKDVKNGTYDKWGLEMGKLMEKNKVDSTPSLVHNGKRLATPGDAEELETVLKSAGIGAKK
ncbi:thioredoxin domain-containing protein [Streptomyces sp. XD-27]|uniref:thioredoxin domain-containing protein n=1 Tax=Streptomyces sp. XD-27 TaxID=3062779 RepID=UPI0026F40B12|nr:thioredoxin domain-containing protein [Streptomyces sp. XD-27]WKX69817.1 thioredoxin domain-containing protein [Streptomyces sp. XD-27]